MKAKSARTELKNALVLVYTFGKHVFSSAAPGVTDDLWYMIGNEEIV